MRKALRCGLVGYGFIASKGHGPVYATRAAEQGDFEVVAIADICEARRAAAAAAFPAARIYASHQELLSREAGRLDVLDITTPPYAHAEIANAAFDRGLHVLCEKPIATTPEDAVSMADHALRARRVFFPGHNYKHAPVIKTVRSLLESGSVGHVKLVSLQTFRTTHARGVSEWRPDWRREKRYSGGGIAMDHGSHTLYLAFEWLGSHPLTVSAKAMTFGAFDTEDNLSCTLTFPNGIATAQLSWTAGARRVMYSIHGDLGAITVEDDRVELVIPDDVRIKRPDLALRAGVQSVPSHWMDASHKEWFGSLLDKFKQAIEMDDFVGPDARDAIMCIKTIAAAYQSSQQSSREQPIERAQSRELHSSFGPFAAE
ncbi:MAG TPA: Gfo/Idh/MocA family oxidoreductase [Polyangiaceae bacterium]